MGGAMDLCAGCPEVIIVMLHTQKGAHKILKECTLPLTAEKCVSKIITEIGVMEVREDGLWVTELHPDYTWEDIQAATGCELHQDPAAGFDSRTCRSVSTPSFVWGLVNLNAQTIKWQ
jgi:acetate CoA/acetoacetate CoA-transferase beta subunit